MHRMYCSNTAIGNFLAYYVVMVDFICLQLKQIVKATNEKAVFKGDHHFQFAENPPTDPPTDPPTGKLVAKVEEPEEMPGLWLSVAVLRLINCHRTLCIICKNLHTVCVHNICM